MVKPVRNRLPDIYGRRKNSELGAHVGENVFARALRFFQIDVDFNIAALPAGRRKDMLGKALDGLLGMFRDRVLPFDTDAARRYAELAVTARAGGRGFPTPDGYIAAIAASRGFMVASRDTAPYEAARVSVINPWVGQ